MAEVQQKEGKKGGKKVKQKKQTLRVDFTPMVDMNMLLITFFMFCTSLSKPQTMDFAMPPKNETIQDKDKPELAEDRAITIILDVQNTVYYYLGKPNYSDPNSLKTSNYSPTSPDGLRHLLLERNKEIVAGIKKLEDQFKVGEITRVSLDTLSLKIKKEVENSPMVMIKPTDKSTYDNLITVLDEMQICNIARYAVMDTTKDERFVMQNLFSGGALTAAALKEGTLKQ